MTSPTLPLPDAEPLRPLPPAARRRARRTLLLLAVVCVLPVVASYLMFYLWPPQGRVNHGTLLEPAPLPATVLDGAGGQPALARAELEGRWTLLLAAPAACDAACTRALYVMRQARLAQAREMARVGRVWLITDGGEPAAEALFSAVSGTSPGPSPGTASGTASGTSPADGLRLARADAAWLEALAPAAPGTIYLVDPRGQRMMRFDDTSGRTAAAQALSRDLQRLLKYSALGRTPPGARP
ncbi:hypothetical protein [Thauera chlorobenzoica]|uniref:Putative cytochrome oxidase accessory protein n=1 Tax=Thauera chlorobenzoica TaxID=96773 RepID=A0A1H5UMS3_9RHOO|nr:hypothetical protein [Thauera chlorobenzoica]APR03537.1 putative cytochrome oxidase accessory protein [Thauera chlorobenzoica]SEF76369.1 hypothetical protein SAMN05216242_105106 [Thauera chlorobenzoica]